MAGRDFLAPPVQETHTVRMIMYTSYEELRKRDLAVALDELRRAFPELEAIYNDAARDAAFIRRVYKAGMLMVSYDMRVQLSAKHAQDRAATAQARADISDTVEQLRASVTSVEEEAPQELQYPADTDDEPISGATVDAVGAAASPEESNAADEEASHTENSAGEAPDEHIAEAVDPLPYTELSTAPSKPRARAVRVIADDKSSVQYPARGTAAWALLCAFADAGEYGCSSSDAHIASGHQSAAPWRRAADLQAKGLLSVVVDANGDPVLRHSRMSGALAKVYKITDKGLRHIDMYRGGISD